MDIKTDAHISPENITEKIWKTSITKIELAELPAETYSGKITIVESEEAAENAAEVLSKTGLIGFDSETKPSFRRGERHSVSLLQLSTLSETFLIRLNHIGLPKCISDILEDERIIKIGVSIHDDFLNLRKKFSLVPKAFKGERLSNWEAPALTIHQQEYAALDALACLHIYNHLKDGKFDYKTSKYYREFDVPTQQYPARQEKNP